MIGPAPFGLEVCYWCNEVGNCLVRQLSLIEVVISIINALYSFQLVIQAFLCSMAAEGVPQVVDG